MISPRTAGREPMVPFMRVFLRRAISSCLLASGCLGPIHAAEKESGERDQGKFPHVSSTFLRAPVWGSVHRGGNVIIPVGVISLPGERIEVRITETPQAGTITVIPGGENGKPALLYQNDPTKKVFGDSFTLRIRAGLRAWITAHGSVAIQDHPGRIAADPERIDFGEIVTGEHVTHVLTLRNVSGNSVEGRLSPRDPFFLEGEGTFTLAEGESREFTLRFAPSLPGNYSSRLESDPFLENFPSISLKGMAGEPFAVQSRSAEAVAGNPLVSFVAVNSGDHPVTVNTTADGELALPASLTIPSSGSATLTVDTSRVAVPVEGTRLLHAFLSGGGSFRIPLEVTVHGSPGGIRLEIPPQQRELHGSPGGMIPLRATLFNDSGLPVHLDVRYGDKDAPAGERSCDLPGKGRLDLELPWTSPKPGLHAVSLTLARGGEVVASSSWSVDLSLPAAPPPSKGIGSSGASPAGGSSSLPGDGSRLATRHERDRMVILHPPRFRDGLFLRHLEIPWTYQGVSSSGFVVEEKVRTGGIQNRTGEEERWMRVQAAPQSTGTPGEWFVSVPMTLAGEREFRIYPAGEGERLVADLPLNVTWSMVLAPALRIAKIAALILALFLALRMWANRRG
jgi:hypothetical protein